MVIMAKCWSNNLGIFELTDSTRRTKAGPQPIHYGTSSDNMLPAIKPNRTDPGRTKRASGRPTRGIGNENR